MFSTCEPTTWLAITPEHKQGTFQDFVEKMKINWFNISILKNL